MTPDAADKAGTARWQALLDRIADIFFIAAGTLFFLFATSLLGIAGFHFVEGVVTADALLQRALRGIGLVIISIAVFDLVQRKAKTGIVSRRLRPTLALVDPDAVRSLPAEVVAASGFDVLCHAIESFTARPYTARVRPSPSTSRPMSQGANPWSDLGSLEALRLGGRSAD